MAKQMTKQELEQEVENLRSALAAQTQTAHVTMARVAEKNPYHRTAGSELMVGVRNISDNTLTLPKVFKGDAEITLHADLGENDPASASILTYTQWRTVQKSKLMEKGAITRDDSVLGEGFEAGPADEPSRDIPPSWFTNAIPNPVEWIESRNEDQIRDDLDKITAEDSFRRLQRVVNLELRRLQNTHADKGTVDSANRAIRQLSGKLQLVDVITTQKLMDMFDTGTGNNVNIDLRGGSKIVGS